MLRALIDKGWMQVSESIPVVDQTELSLNYLAELPRSYYWCLTLWRAGRSSVQSTLSFGTPGRILRAFLCLCLLAGLAVSQECSSSTFTYLVIQTKCYLPLFFFLKVLKSLPTHSTSCWYLLQHFVYVIIIALITINWNYQRFLTGSL